MNSSRQRLVSIGAIILLIFVGAFFFGRKKPTIQEPGILLEEDVSEFANDNADFSVLQNYARELGFTNFVESRRVKKQNLVSIYAIYDNQDQVIMVVKDSAPNYSFSYLETISSEGDQVLLTIFDEKSSISFDLKEIYNGKFSWPGFFRPAVCQAADFLGREVSDIDKNCVIRKLLDSMDWDELPSSCQECLDDNDDQCNECMLELGEQLTEILFDALNDDECRVNKSRAELKVTEVNVDYGNQVFANQAFDLNYTITNSGGSVDWYNVMMGIYNMQGGLVKAENVSDNDGMMGGGASESSYFYVNGLPAGNYKATITVERVDSNGTVSDTYSRLFLIRTPVVETPASTETPAETEAPSSPAAETPVETGSSAEDSEPEKQNPMAVIDSIAPNPAVQEEVIEFKGHGTDSDSYQWELEENGNYYLLSQNRSFSYQAADYLPGTSINAIGVHKICFRVSGQGQWSQRVCQSLTINQKPNQKPQATLEISPNPAYMDQQEVISEQQTRGYAKVHIRGSGSDSDGSIAGCHLDLGSSQVDACDVYQEYDVPGTYQIKLKVKDDQGLWSDEQVGQLTVYSSLAITTVVECNPETIQSGEAATCSLNITNNGLSPVEIQEVYVYWYLYPPAILAQTDWVFPSVAAPWTWQESIVPAGQTKTVAVYSDVKDSGHWQIMTFVTTNLGSIDLGNSTSLYVD